MRFIFYFIFFGLLFYIISLYFPEAFQTLVSWAAKVYNFLHDLVVGIVDKLNALLNTPKTPEQPAIPETPNQIAQFLRFFNKSI